MCQYDYKAFHLQDILNICKLLIIFLYESKKYMHLNYSIVRNKLFFFFPCLFGESTASQSQAGAVLKEDLLI